MTDYRVSLKDGFTVCASTTQGGSSVTGDKEIEEHEEIEEESTSSV